VKLSCVIEPDAPILSFHEVGVVAIPPKTALDCVENVERIIDLCPIAIELANKVNVELVTADGLNSRADTNRSLRINYRIEMRDFPSLSG